MSALQPVNLFSATFAAAASDPCTQPTRLLVVAFEEVVEGRIHVKTSEGVVLQCLHLATGVDEWEPYQRGALLLVASGVQGSTDPIIVGAIGDAHQKGSKKHLRLRAEESLSLQCGESSIDLRADGKVLIKGDDVTVRAKGTKRIRAGTVSIN